MFSENLIIQSLRQKIENNIPLDRQDAEKVALMDGPDLMDVFALANRIRARLGDVVDLCSIANAKCGLCPEDCRFCAQSAHNQAEIEAHPLMAPEEILELAYIMQDLGASRFCIVTSGHQIKEMELEEILSAVRTIKKETGLSICTSIGTLTPESAHRLKEAGVTRIHHNLETSRRFFGNVCTTHTYEERLNTIKVAKEYGFEVCCGGLIGVGESMKDRIDLAFTLRDFDIDSIPLNILNPIPGTPLEDAEPLEPMEILKTIALFRLILPNRNIRIAGGREKNLRSLQAMGLLCGANGLMIGNYLTTDGQNPADDLRMIRDTGLFFDEINITV